MMDELSSMTTSNTALTATRKPISPVSATELPTRPTPDTPGMDTKSTRQPNLANGTADAQMQQKDRALDSSKGAGFTTAPDKIPKPSVAIPQMNRTNSQLQSQSGGPSPAQTPSSATSSRRTASKRTSLANLIPTRPAPPSPISNPSSRNVSRRPSRAFSIASSTHSTQRSPSHKNSTSSIRKSFVNDSSGGVVRVSASRRQSTLVISYTAPTATTTTTAPDGDESSTNAAERVRDTALVEKGPDVTQPITDAKVAASSPVAAFSPSDPKPDAAAPPIRRILDPLSAMNPPKANAKPTTTADGDTNVPLRRNFSSTSASTSGASTTSDSSNPARRHANELEEAYGIFHSQTPSSTTTATTTNTTRPARSGSGASGTHTPLFSTRPRSIIQSLWGNRTRTMGEDTTTTTTHDASNFTTEVDSPPPPSPAEPPNPHETVTDEIPPKEGDEVECTDVAWAKAHPIVVRDWAYEEGDARFAKVPPQALLSVLRPSKVDSSVEARRPSRGRGNGYAYGASANGYIAGYGGYSGRAPHYGSGAQYGGRWGEDDFDEDDFDDGEEEDEEDEEGDDDDDDGWGFPMGTVSGGPAPLGTTLLGGKRSRRKLKNRVRAWNGLGGSKSVGGRLVSEESSEAEGESSGFYEEEDTGATGRRDPVDGEGDAEEGDVDDGWGAEVQTPSKAYHSFVGDAGYPPEHPLDPLPAVSRLPTDGIDGGVHADAEGVDADHEDDEDEGDSTDYDDAIGLRTKTDVVKPGLYRVLFSFDAEGENEMSIAEGQILRVLGTGGEGWAIAVKEGKASGGSHGVAGLALEDAEDADEHGLVPLGYLELHTLD